MKIYVEGDLGYLKGVLHEEGYEVIQNQDDAEAIIVKGMDQNNMGIQRTGVSVPILVARGKTPEKIMQELQERLDV